jgi:hypothetical protein
MTKVKIILDDLTDDEALGARSDAQADDLGRFPTVVGWQGGARCHGQRDDQVAARACRGRV